MRWSNLSSSFCLMSYRTSIKAWSTGINDRSNKPAARIANETGEQHKLPSIRQGEMGDGERLSDHMQSKDIIQNLLSAPK